MYLDKSRLVIGKSISLFSFFLPSKENLLRDIIKKVGKFQNFVF